MAAELQQDYWTGKVVYYLLRNSVGQIWNGSAFVAYLTVNYSTYAITATEQGTASGFYVGDMPAAAAGAYGVVAKERAGGSPAETDVTIGTGEIQWNGTTVASLLTTALSSGQSVLVYSGQLSGQPETLLSGQSFLASGGTWLSSGHQAVLYSGQSVLVYSGQLSGQKLNLSSGNLVEVLSGTSVNVFSGQLSGQEANANVIKWQGTAPNALLASGRVDAAFNVRTNVARSGTAGTLQLDAGAPTGTSGVYDGHVLTIVGGSGLGESRVIQNYGSSGIAFVSPPWTVAAFNNSVFTISPGGTLSGQTFPASGVNTVASLLSGQSTLTYSGQLSGQPITLLSGLSYVASGINAVSPIASGALWLSSGQAVSLNSGQSVLVYSGQLSGQPETLLSGLSYVASGINVTATASITSGAVWLSSGQAVSLNSGQSTLTYSGQLSGQPLTLLSGFSYPASGVFVNATATLASGQVWLSSGQAVSLNSGQSTLTYSGQLSGQLVTLTSGQSWTASGIFAVATATVTSGQVWLASGQATSLNSGQSVLVYSGQLSGQPETLLSGLSYPASGINVTATATLASGQVWLSSGQAVSLNSGQSTLTYSGQLSGQQVNLLSGNQVQVWSGTQVNTFSGQQYLASGSQVVVLSGAQVALFSGQQVAVVSGTQVNVFSGQTWLSSGQAVSVNSGQLSGQPVTLLSGLSFTASGINVTATATLASGQVYLASGQAVSLNSGQQVQVYSGQLSGQPVTLLSGQSFPASGLRVVAASVLDKSGYNLGASGLDHVLVAGKTLPHAVQIIGATTAGILSGAGTGTERFGDFTGAQTVVVTFDNNNNRTSATYSV